MKKTYLNPEMEIVMLETLQMIAASQGGVSTGGKPGEEYTEGDTTYSPEYEDEDDDLDW